MAKPKKKEKSGLPVDAPRKGPRDDGDDIDFPTVVWSLVILAVLVLVHRLVWGG
ncbi:MAG: hypothetical protein ABIK65_08100 [Candidatus Eisenbacteria bacterium]